MCLKIVSHKYGGKKANYPSCLAQNKALKYLHGLNETESPGFPASLAKSLCNLTGSTTLTDNMGITNLPYLVHREVYGIKRKNTHQVRSTVLN